MIISCATPKTQSKITESFNEISFGSGGGFTGLTHTYLLKNNREVFKLHQHSPTQINKISRNEIKDIVNLLNNLNFHELQFTETGNMTYFIEVKTKTYTQRVSWTDRSNEPNIKAFYKTLINTIK